MVSFSQPYKDGGDKYGDRYVFHNVLVTAVLHLLNTEIGNRDQLLTVMGTEQGLCLAKRIPLITHRLY